MRLRLELFKGCFNVGFIENQALAQLKTLSYDKIKWLDLDGYTHGWFADPFIYQINSNTIVLLVEELEYKNNKGRICKITVDKSTYKLLQVEPLLELSTHLSYPYICDIDGKIYICPENNEGGAVRAYEFSNNQLVNPQILIPEPLVDTQFLKLKGKFYAFGVKNICGAMEETKRLEVFESDSFFGPYRHIQTIENSKCEERGAGAIICNGDKIYRPVQCCEGGYGRAVIFKELRKVDGQFVENEIFRIHGSFYRHWGLGMHQYHSKENWSVVDGMDYFYFIARIVKRIQMYHLK